MSYRLAAFLALAMAYVACPQALAGPNDIAIIIGNREYQGDVPKVEFAERDAEAFAKAARDVLGVPEANIIRLPNATGTVFRRWFGADGSGSAQLSALVKGRDSRIYIFYSGHGMPSETSGPVLLPVDAVPDPEANEGYPIERIREAVNRVQREKAPEGRAILLFDACFSGNSNAGTLLPKTSAVTLSASKLRESVAGREVMISASAANEVAYWDTERKQGAFTDALLDGLYGGAADEKGQVTADTLTQFIVRRVSDRMISLYPNVPKRQTPMLLGAGQAVLVSLSKKRPVRDEEVAAHERTMCRILPVSDDPSRIQTFLGSCRECACREILNTRIGELHRVNATCRAERRQLEGLSKRAAAAKLELEALAKTADCVEVRNEANRQVAALQAPPAATAPVPATIMPSPRAPGVSDIPQPGSGKTRWFKDCPTCPDMVVIPAGRFVMGSPRSEDGRAVPQEDQISVSIREAFAVGRFAVTFDEWDACVDDGGCGGYQPHDQGWGRGKRPVIGVQWGDALAYTTWLSDKTGKVYRLLSETEREYVTRAGTSSPYWWGTSITPVLANYNDQPLVVTSGSTVPVDSFKPNPWGLYNVHGNVSEWTQDCWNDSNQRTPGDGSARVTGECRSRVVRGGSWFDSRFSLRAAKRTWNWTGYRGQALGFRVARSL